MISPSTPAAPAGIGGDTGPATRTVVAAGHCPGVLSVPAATTHDPAPSAVGVTGTSLGPTARLSPSADDDRRDRDRPEIGTQIRHQTVSTGFRAS